MKANKFINPLKYTKTFKAIMDCRPEKQWPVKSQDDLYMEDIATWNAYKNPITLRLVFDQSTSRYIYTAQFPKYDQETQSFQTYIKGSFEYIDYQDWTISHTEDQASIDVGEEELHIENMSLFEFAVGLDQFKPGDVWLTQTNKPPFDLPTILNIPEYTNFFKYYPNGLPF